MAQVIRSVLIDVFKEAQHAGEVAPGYNPALATKQPRRKITRQRLSAEKWKKTFELADSHPKYLGNAMLLAVVTGQRLGDISNMKFTDAWDNHLHVVQQKTGSKVAIPLSLHCEAIGWTLRGVIARCRELCREPIPRSFFQSNISGRAWSPGKIQYHPNELQQSTG